MKETIYYVSGMHCGACEILVEHKLLEQPGVKVVDASLSNGTIRIEHEGHIPPVKQLEKWFKSDAPFLNKKLSWS